MCLRGLEFLLTPATQTGLENISPISGVFVIMVTEIPQCQMSEGLQNLDEPKPGKNPCTYYCNIGKSSYALAEIKLTWPR
ncbi:hypothetical protein C5167_050712 [Papaver somniferum]|uniref:Uncharacterized protein n=1 Tax=Papaver somniferum TaxID=3469 RepID=A0A4Y7KTE6_PAPSO|nr:hypothetical protein C5167_050712 [Papaver somniferum]